MIRKFSILFSFNFTHDFFRDEIFRGFELIPTVECRRLMRNYDLLFKKKGDQFVVLCQKIGREMDNLSVIRKIDRQVRFSFILQLKEATLPNLTDFGPKQPKRLVGKPIFYFNNLDKTTGSIDPDLVAGDNQMALTVNPTVSYDDQIFLTPSNITLPFVKTEYDKLKFKPKTSPIFELLPEGGNQKSLNQVALLSNHPLGPYDMEVKHTTDANEDVSFSIYTAERSLTTNPPYGIIDIYQNEQINYDFEKAYFLQFARKSTKRRYFIVNTSERAIPLNGDGSPKMSVQHPNINYDFLSENQLITIDPSYQRVVEGIAQDFFPFAVPLYQKEIPELELIVENQTIINNLPGANIYSPRPNDVFVHI